MGSEWQGRKSLSLYGVREAISASTEVVQFLKLIH